MNKQKAGPKNQTPAVLALLLVIFSAPFILKKSPEPPAPTAAETAASAEKQAAAVALIRLAGYKCDEITTLRPALTGGGLDQVARCDGGLYTYDLQDKGGHWTVTPN